MGRRLIWGINEKTVNQLTNLTWYVDIDFHDRDLLFKAIELGFDPIEWEETNNNKVLIDDVWYIDKIKR